jgi:outer membrane lipoprotein-sorting protein
MKKLIFVLSLLVLAKTTNAQNDPKATQVLDQVSQNYKAIPAFKANFTVLRESPNSGRQPESETGSIKVKGTKYHIKLKEQEVFNNGTTVWTYLKRDNEVTITDYTPDDDDITPTKIYTIYKKGYKYVYAAEEKEAGQSYDVIDLTPENKNQQVYKIKLIIDKKTKTLKKWKVFEKNGNRTTYTVNDFTPGNLEDKEFTFDKAKYPKVKEEDLR